MPDESETETSPGTGIPAGVITAAEAALDALEAPLAPYLRLLTTDSRRRMAERGRVSRARGAASGKENAPAIPPAKSRRLNSRNAGRLSLCGTRRSSLSPPPVIPFPRRKNDVILML
ncbi:MAG: hypothetical protein MdMp014T_0891 [Treponematales bacterium]